MHSQNKITVDATTLLIVMATVLSTLMAVFLLVLPALFQVSPGNFLKMLANKDLPVVAQQLLSQKGENQAIGKIQANTIKPEPSGLSPLEQSSTILDAHEQTFSLQIPPKQGLALRFYMEQDYDLHYRWRTDGQPIFAELRGRPQTPGEGKLKVFGKLTGDKANGLFITPFTGNYEWYWENKSGQKINVRFTAKGAYKVIGQIRYG